MLKVKVYDMKAKEVGEMELNESVFNAEYNEPLIHEVIVAYLANQRQGTKSTLTRSEVRGHAKKPWRQKKTGRARQGSTKSPQWTGGGVAFAPKPRDFSKKVNAKAKAVAFRSALSAKLANKEITVVDSFTLAEMKTKLAQEFVDAFNFTKSVKLVIAQNDDVVLRTVRNIPNITVTTANLVNTYDIVASKNVVLTQDAIKFIEEANA